MHFNMSFKQFGSGLLALTFLTACSSAQAASPEGTPSWPCLTPATISSTIPTNPILLQDADADCFAWQEFIALNWQAEEGNRGTPDGSKGKNDFGTPGFNPTVWQTYKSDKEVFLPKAAPPRKWNDPAPAPICSNELPAAELQGRHVLTMTNGATEEFDHDSLDQAYPFDGPNWLADVNGNPVWYEMKLNKVEYDGIVKGLFYNADAQLCIAQGGRYNAQTQACTPGSPSPQLVKLPDKSMELKAAWRQLTDPSQYTRYLTTKAIIVQNGKCVPATMGLVGLHIIQKTPNQPNWVWATFEHVDNAPDDSSANVAASTLGHGFSFFSPSCKTQQISTRCFQGERSTTCTANTPPAYTLDTWLRDGTCPPYPVQTTRITPISDVVRPINTLVKQMIVSANQKSVFQYYQLIDTVWATSTTDPYALGDQPCSPLPMPIMEPANSVANTTMETFVQDFSPMGSNGEKSMCINCHRNATVSGSQNYGSDYSFLLGSATRPHMKKPAVRSMLNVKKDPSTRCPSPSGHQK